MPRSHHRAAGFNDRTAVRVKYRLKGALARVVPLDRVLWCSRGKRSSQVALTFDDGPDPTVTPMLLDTLDELGVRATFFLVGRQLGREQEIGRAIHTRGHQIGSHGYEHRSILPLDDAELLGDLERNGEAIAGVGAGRPTLYRPPLGECRLRQYRLFWRLGMTVVLWSVDARDFAAASAGDVVRNVAPARLAGGDILLLHDRFRHTVDAVRELVPMIQDRGLTLATVGEMIDRSGEAAG